MNSILEIRVGCGFVVSEFRDWMIKLVVNSESHLPVCLSACLARASHVADRRPPLALSLCAAPGPLPASGPHRSHLDSSLASLLLVTLRVGCGF